MVIKRIGNVSVALVILLAVLSSCRRGPDPRADKAIRKYEGLPGVYTLRIPPALLSLGITDSTSADIKDFLSSMKTIKVMLVNKAETTEKSLDGFEADLLNILDEDHFEDLLELSESEDRVVVKVHQEGEMIDEAMVLIMGRDEFLGLSLVGNIDPSNLGNVVKELSINDFDLPGTGNHSRSR